MNTMKQPATSFGFKRNTDIHALPDAVPPQVPAVAPQREKRVAVRKDHQVSCYLSEEEYQALVAKLDGRPIAAVVRNLVLKHMQNG
jgi:hypothetical protein